MPARMKLLHLADPSFTAPRVSGFDGPAPRGLLARCAGSLRTAYRGFLTLLVEHKGEFFLLDTDIDPQAVPGIQFDWSMKLSERFDFAFYSVLQACERNAIANFPVPVPPFNDILPSLREVAFESERERGWS